MNGHLVFNVLDAIMRYKNKFQHKEDREIIEKLYILIM
jgi:hypothetical protein